MKLQLKASNRTAMTITELMVAMGISAIIAVAIGSMMFYGSRSFASLANYLQMSQESRHSLDQLSSDIRHAVQLTSFSQSPPQLEFSEMQLVDATNEMIGTLIYSYNPATKQLLRLETTNGSPWTTNILLRDCDSFQFQLYKRNPQAGPSPTNYLTTVPALCKLVELKWHCSKEIMQRTANTEEIQTARIVLRN